MLKAPCRPGKGQGSPRDRGRRTGAAIRRKNVVSGRAGVMAGPAWFARQQDLRRGGAPSALGGESKQTLQATLPTQCVSIASLLIRDALVCHDYFSSLANNYKGDGDSFDVGLRCAYLPGKNELTRSLHDLENTFDPKGRAIRELICDAVGSTRA